MSNVFKLEPALILGVVSATLILLVAFGVPITEVQSQAVMGLVGAVFTLGAAIVTRQMVTPNPRVAAREDATGTTVSGPADATSTDGAPVVVRPAPGELVDSVEDFVETPVDPMNAME